MRRRTATAMLGAVGLALVLALPAAADLRDEQALAAALCPGREARGAAGGVRPRRAVRADGRRPSVRPVDRRAARSVEPDRSREDRPHCEGPRRPLRVPPRLPRERARPRLRLRAVGAAPDHGSRARGVCARRNRPRLPGQARAAVLVLLPVQRLQQHARGRLGDDPAGLRRARRRRGDRRGASRRRRLQLARGRRAGGLG